MTLLLTLPLRADPVPNTQPLTTQGDLASQMIDGIDRFLLKQTDKAIAKRIEQWSKERPSNEQLRTSLSTILGLRDPRPTKVELELVATIDQPALIAKSPDFEVYAVRWPAFGSVHGEGLLLKPIGREGALDVIAIPDADQTPEQIAGLTKDLPKAFQFARSFAEIGFRVLIPTLIDRHVEKRIAPGRTDGPALSSREFVHRPAYVVGRSIIGYEVQKVHAGLDWLQRTQGKDRRHITVVGWGEGGMIALLAGALDSRITSVGSSGYFGNGSPIWKQPLERNLFGFTNTFGDAELAAMNSRAYLEHANGPVVKVSSKGAAPGELTALGHFKEEYERAVKLASDTQIKATGDGDDTDLILHRWKTAEQLLDLYGYGATIPRDGEPPKLLIPAPDPAPRQKRQLDQLLAHTQSVLRNSANVRREFLKNLDTSSIEKYEASAKTYRETFYNDVIGRFDEPLLPLNPRTRKTWDNEKWAGYEVMLDVFPDVFAYGVLLLPKDLKPGDKRPVVVCQHGLEGRPTDTFLNDNKSYHDYAATLAERGFITFAPQNPYIFTDRFRSLQRKANPIGKSLFSIIIPQHQQIINFLKTLPGVDEKRIAFYGLSYGGKTAMRVPAVLTDYCLSICSADFNEWVWKNAGTDHPYSYVYTGEYEIFEWNLGSTFNYAEMAALIAPRPFMVERGHFDGVSSDEMVAFEFAKVRRLYNGQLKIGDRCEIEFFAGPHTINGKGTFDFLHKHLNWKKR